jgi:hypothetical protein
MKKAKKKSNNNRKNEITGYKDTVTKTAKKINLGYRSYGLSIY